MPEMDLAKIRAAAHSLNRITDRASEAVKAAETFLNDTCSIGIPARVPVVDMPGTFLGYDRHGQRYRIVVAQAEAVPWADCTRDMKLKTFAQLPALLDAIQAVIDAQVALAASVVDTTIARLAIPTPQSVGVSGAVPSIYQNAEAHRSAQERKALHGEDVFKFCDTCAQQRHIAVCVNCVVRHAEWAKARQRAQASRTCPDCNGTGFGKVDGERTPGRDCVTCRGDGAITREEEDEPSRFVACTACANQPGATFALCATCTAARDRRAAWEKARQPPR